MRAVFFAPLLLTSLLACQGEEAPPRPDYGGDTDTDMVLPPPDCSQYEFQGQVYNCDVLDRCNEEDLTYRLACCECYPETCNPDPNCEDPIEPPPEGKAESCMECHNGSDKNDYYGDGISNPHPFAQSGYVLCSTCHGGNPEGGGKEDSHVPAPPEIGDDLNLQNDPHAYFNRLTLTGIDKFADYTVDGKTYSGLDYLQFVNPGDLRVVGDGRSCGVTGCHGGEHVEWVSRYPIATEVGFYSATLYSSGVNNAVPAQQDIYQETAGDYAFRYVSDPTWTYDSNEVGRVGTLLEFPERAVYGETGGIYDNAIYDSTQLANYVWAQGESNEYAQNQIKTGQPMEDLLIETVAFACGDCHLGSAGQNNRYADFRSSGCTACHMEYSYDGRSRSTDPNVPKFEPANPDQIVAPERSHIESHQIRNVAKILDNGAFVRGISDKACAGCHQGSNRTVLQYWGVRLDQNQDLTNGFQYPANPIAFTDATNDTRLFDPGVNNQTFNGRVPEQLIVFEDYDGDGRDDIPSDVHYEAGMGCIDCHSSRDVHGGTEGDPTSGWITSRQDQAMGVACTSCHGSVDAYAETVPCTTYTGGSAECPVDTLGNAMRNVTVDTAGDFWLVSRVDGQRHYVPQTRDTVVNNQKVHPITSRALYSPLASYAMGRADGDPQTGTGPIQADNAKFTNGFSHTDDMECVACHASWTNSCVGCHLGLAYDDDPANYFFSNTTGQRISTFVNVADFVYQSPVLMTLGVGSRDKITQTQPGMKMFFRYLDYNGVESQVFAFTDRNGNGNNPNVAGRGDFGALAHNKIMAHSVRGKVDDDNEGPRYCVACHLTDDAINNFGTEYADFRDDIDNRNYADLDFDLLQEHIGLNPSNQLNSPFFVHMAAGLGTGLFAFDAFGCPVNPLDENANRQYCQNGAPAANFDADDIQYDLDKIAEFDGTTNASNGHPMLDGNSSGNRAGALEPNLAGPFGAVLLERLTDPDVGLVLDSWLDADSVPGGNADDYIQ